MRSGGAAWPCSPPCQGGGRGFESRPDRRRNRRSGRRSGLCHWQRYGLGPAKSPRGVRSSRLRFPQARVERPARAGGGTPAHNGRGGMESGSRRAGLLGRGHLMRRRSLVSEMYRAARIANDIWTIASGTPAGSGGGPKTRSWGVLWPGPGSGSCSGARTSPAWVECARVLRVGPAARRRGANGGR
jgi:hypothetical protein